ncbi:MAG: putative flagellar hook-length control protein, partial [Proteobacteria bacterium]|nr:putative flagellar hook-length control protein [Pseudomonadota bacterium]
PQEPAGQRAPSEMEIAPRLLTPEPPGTNTTGSTAAERFQDIPPATPSAVAEKGIGANNLSEQGPRANLPSPREGSDRLGSTLLADSPEATVSLKTLQQHAEGALARIVLDQLASLPQGDGKQLVWQMEIPFVDEGRSDSAKFKIIREEKSGGAQSGQPYWSAVLELSPPGLGTIHSRITLWGERVDTYFWSDLNSTSALIQDNLDLLAARLQQAGLEIGQLNALPGTPPGAKIEAAQSCKLVDERA